MFDGSPWVDVRNYGAVGDGSTDDYQAIQDAVNDVGDGGSIYFPPGDYFITDTVEGLNQVRLVGPEAQGHFFWWTQDGVRIKGEESDIGDGDPLFRCSSDGSGVQDVGFYNIRFRGDTSVDPDDLENAQSTGVIGIDATGVKDGLTVRGCSFRGLKTGVSNDGSGSYLGRTVIDKSMIRQCYTALDLTTTVPMSVRDSGVYNCHDWINADRIGVSGCAFQNDSFATDRTNISGSLIHARSNWFEGGNDLIDTDDYDFGKLVAVGNFFRACSASSGSRKAIFRPAETSTTIALGNYGQDNNRVAYVNHIDDFSDSNWFLLGNEFRTYNWVWDDPAENGATFLCLDSDREIIRNFDSFGFTPTDLTGTTGFNGQMQIHDGSGTPPFGLAVWDGENSEWVSQIDGSTFT